MLCALPFDYLADPSRRTKGVRYSLALVRNYIKKKAHLCRPNLGPFCQNRRRQSLRGGGTVLDSGTTIAELSAQPLWRTEVISRQLTSGSMESMRVTRSRSVWLYCSASIGLYLPLVIFMMIAPMLVALKK